MRLAGVNAAEAMSLQRTERPRCVIHMALRGSQRWVGTRTAAIFSQQSKPVSIEIPLFTQKGDRVADVKPTGRHCPCARVCVFMRVSVWLCATSNSRHFPMPQALNLYYPEENIAPSLQPERLGEEAAVTTNKIQKTFSIFLMSISTIPNEQTTPTTPPRMTISTNWAFLPASVSTHWVRRYYHTHLSEEYDDDNLTFCKFKINLDHGENHRHRLFLWSYQQKSGSQQLLCSGKKKTKNKPTDVLLPLDDKSAFWA